MVLDKEKLRALSPAERIRKLREIEKESRKEIEEAEKLIRESEENLRVEEATADVEIPETEEVDITKLFSEEENLEGTIKKEEKEVDEEQVKYEISKIKEYAEHLGEGPASTYTMGKIEEMGENLRNIDYKLLSQEVADELNATRNVIYEMKKHAGMR